MPPLEAFTAWFTNQGGYLHPSVEFAHEHDQGYILRVKEAKSAESTSSPLLARRLPRNTTVISAPHALSLSALNAAPPSPSSSTERTTLDDRVSRSPPRDGVDGSNGAAAAVRQVSFQTSPIPHLPAEFLCTARPQCIAAVWLCVQYLLGGSSPWREYVAILPRPPHESASSASTTREAAHLDFDLERGDAFDAGVAGYFPGPEEIDTAMWWGEEERAWIRGTNLDKGIEDLEGSWGGEWGQWKGVLGAWAEECELAGMDWNLFKWAVSIFGSRAFSSAVLAFVSSSATGKPVLEEGDPHALLYPGIDMLNHNGTTCNEWFCDAERFGLICNDEPGPGEQIWNSYGKKGNAELLLSFGFSLVTNDFDAFALKLPQTPSPLLSQIDDSASPPANGTNSTSKNNNNSSRTKPTAISSVRRLPATTRFPSDTADPSAPYKTLSLNETDTLESHDPDANIYYVRSASCRHARLASDAYPSVDPSGPPSAHLAGFPIPLLRQLAALLANGREAAAAVLRADACSGMGLLWELGERDELAVSALLLSRLEMEGKRLAGLLATELAADARMKDGGGGEYVRARRKKYARAYVEGQLRLLAEKVRLLRRRVVWAVAGSGGEEFPAAHGDAEDGFAGHFTGLREVQDSNTKSTAPTSKAAPSHILGLPKRSSFLTIPHALNHLRAIAPIFADEFVAGVLLRSKNSSLAGHKAGGTEKAMDEQLEAIRSGEDDRDEEDILLLLIGAIFIALFRLGGASRTDAMERPPAAIMRRWGCWHGWYGLKAAFAQMDDSARVAKEAGQEIDEAAVAAQEEIAQIQSIFPEMRLWSHDSWSRAGFMQACVRIVTEETVSSRMRRTEYEILRASEMGNETLAKRYLEESYDPEPGFVSRLNETRIVALYVAPCTAKISV